MLRAYESQGTELLPGMQVTAAAPASTCRHLWNARTRRCSCPGTERLPAGVGTQVTVSGIPIMPAFVEAAARASAEDAAQTREACLAAFGLDPPSVDARPVVVLISSGKQLVLAAYRELPSHAVACHHMPSHAVTCLPRPATLPRRR